ncbi:MAG: EAL domain-containing protein, partial [Chromatiaceae bacterium]|nr:EAL domain-containing protein [Chromatiaceae bacterium]
MTQSSRALECCLDPASHPHSLCRLLFDQSAEGIVITDAEARILAVNPAFAEITGYAPEEALGRNPRFLNSGREDKAFFRTLWNALEVSGSWRGELWNRRRNGELYRQWLSIHVARDAEGRVLHYVGLLSDITERHRSAEEIDYLSNYDPVTGLANARLLRARLGQMLASARAHEQHLGIFYVDIDHYNDVIASHGHAVADEVLEHFGEVLSAVVAPGDLLARLSDDTFVIVAEVASGFASASSLAAHYQEVCCQPIEVAGGERLMLTASVGVAIYPEDGIEVHELLRNAASALLSAKRSGRRSIAFYRPEITAAASQRLALEGALRKALIEREFVLHYQPLVNPLDGSLQGAEALLRWQRGEELMAPGGFIALAESSDLILPLGAWVLDSALRQVRAWRDAGLPVPRVSVNVSERQIAAGQLAEEIAALLRRYALEPEVLQIEVVERVLLRDPDQALCELERVRALGVGIALDDFGTGYSSLSYLTRFPVDCLKIDRSFVSQLASEPRQWAIVRAILSMARSLDIGTVAEGVEERAQLRMLAEAGCN